jgi:hypothetical protein
MEVLADHGEFAGFAGIFLGIERSWQDAWMSLTAARVAGRHRSD